MPRRIVLSPVVSRTGTPTTHQVGAQPVRVIRTVLKPVIRVIGATVTVTPPPVR